MGKKRDKRKKTKSRSDAGEPGEAAGKIAGKTSGEVPGKASRKTSGEAPGKTPRKDLTRGSTEGLIKELKELTKSGVRGKTGARRKGAKTSRFCRYVGMAILSLGGLSACGLFRPAQAERETFRTEVGDSLRRTRYTLFESQGAARSVRRGTVAWREICLSPPDSAGRQYVSRIRTAATRAVETTRVEDTLSVRSFREDTEVGHSSTEGTRRQRVKPASRWKWAGIGGGLLLMFLFYRRGFRSG